MRIHRYSTSKQLPLSAAGYTLLELIIIIAIIGILSAIAAPAWFSFVERQQLNSAQNQVYRAMQEAKSNATREKITWQVSFRQIRLNGKDVVQWSIHPAEPANFIPISVTTNNALWHNLDPAVLIDTSKNDQDKYETSLTKQTATGPWRVQFNYYGCPVRQSNDECGQTSLTALGRITLRGKSGSKLRRCIIISTLLGAMRAGKDYPTVDSTGKYCH